MVRLRDNCSAWAHTDCLNKSGGKTLLFVSVFVKRFVYKFAYLLKILGGYNVEINIDVVIKPFWRLNTNSDNNLYSRLYTRSRLSIGCG